MAMRRWQGVRVLISTMVVFGSGMWVVVRGRPNRPGPVS